jgi:twitching motility protein PilI
MMASGESIDSGSRRTRLRQYQAQLLERMQAARSNTGARVSQLGVQLGQSRVLLDLGQAGEIVPLMPLTTVPLTQPWYLGLANIRGNLVSVVDLARFLGLGDTLVGPDCRVITFGTALGVNCAMLVSKVHGLRNAGAMEAEGDGLRDSDGVHWTVLDLAALVRDQRFMQIGF